MRGKIRTNVCALSGRARTMTNTAAHRSVSGCVLVAMLSVALTTGGCEGRLGTPDPVSDAPGKTGSGSGLATAKELQIQCEEMSDGLHPGPAPLRRLTRAEYDRTVEDLLEDDSALGSAFPPEARALGFNGVAEAQTVTSLLVEAYLNAAEILADRASADLDGLLGCDPMEVDCVSDFVAHFGGLAYRRPLTDAEAARLMTVFEWGRDNMNVGEGVQMVLEVLLQSPDFLYRPEFGDQVVEDGIVRLSSYEMATRLSYLFLGSSPDQELRRAADNDELVSGEQVALQADRLLKDERARATFRSFHSQWLDLEAVEHIERDPAVYEGYEPNIPQLFREETESFIEHVIFENDGSLLTMLTAPYTMANRQLAEFYGLPAPEGEGFQRVTTDAERAGLLTQGSLLAHHAQPLSTSPVHRGKFIREAFFCQFPPAPPADLIIVPPELDADLTTRERYAAHSADASCAGCHKLMDPLGLGLEHFDPVGRYRSTENGHEVDASGEFFDSDIDGEFYGAVELGEGLAASAQVATCLTKQWLRFAQGRSETPEDACSLSEVGEKFESTSYHIPTLVRELTQTDAFLYREEVKP